MYMHSTIDNIHMYNSKPVDKVDRIVPMSQWPTVYV